MRNIPVGLLLALCLATWAGAGTVALRDGTKLSGEVTLLDGKLRVAADGAPRELALAEVDWAKFADAKPAATRPTTQPWKSQDIGQVFREGFSTISGGRIGVVDAGRGFRSSEKKGYDSFHFVHQPLPADGQITARLLVMSENRLARAGLMIRQSLSPDSPFAMLVREGDREPAKLLVRRHARGDIESVGSGPRPVYGALWLKLSKQGNRVSAFESMDGKKWNVIGEQNLLVSDGEGCHIGLAGSTGAGTRLGEALFDRVGVALEAAAGESRVPRGVVLRSGTVLAGRVSMADDTKVSLETGDGKQMSLAVGDVSLLILRPLPRDAVSRLTGAKTGALLNNDDFVEGQFKGIENQKVKLASVLLGARTFDAAHDVLAVALHSQATADCEFEVELSDGSILRASGIRAEGGALRAQVPPIGGTSLSLDRVILLRRGSAGARQ